MPHDRHSVRLAWRVLQLGQVNMDRLNPALLLKYSATAKLDPYAVSGKVSLALFDELVATASVMCERG